MLFFKNHVCSYLRASVRDPAGCCFFKRARCRGVARTALARFFFRNEKSTAREFHPDTSAHKLVLLRFFFAVAFRRLGADFFVILLQGREIFTGFGEFAFFHAFADVPVHERALGVHQVELVIETREHLRDGGGVGDHAHRSLHLGEVAARYHGGGLVVDTALEPGGAPINKLNRALGLDRRDGGVDVLGHHVAAVHQAARHVLAVPGVALGHHRRGLVRGVGDFRDG
mmetsp:Transcript_8227/g.30765  ORF Transcript_8227/g.30765 Transcript_8227/m.30765 type:complete len:228 (-) Transcript_8227:1106-1789(-)